MNRGAICHMPDSRYCFCVEPGRFVFRLQTGRDDLRGVKLHFRDKYIPVRILDTRGCAQMRRVAQDGCHDYYEAELQIDVVCLRYFFELTGTDGECLYYGNCRFYTKEIDDNDRMYDLPQTLRETEQFEVPQWAKNKVVYQVFPSRFATSKDVPDKLWYKAPIAHNTDLKGDLRGMISKLGYIRDLGVDVLYLTPIFHSKSTHKYDTIDYYTIDPSFGTKEDLIELVDKAHEMGLRVVLDAVFNHTAPEFFAFQDLEKNWQDSPYRNWYYCKEKPKRPMLPFVKPNYKCFSYFGGMPKLNLTNPETARYCIDVALYWLRTAGIDGWRLDVGDEVSHYFWREFRKAVKAEFPDALIVGEVWHYAADFLQGDEWDSVMNYPFLNAAMDFVAKGEITATEYLNELGFLRGNLNHACYSVMWNLLGSHDTARALNRCAEDKRKMKLMAAMQLLQSGMPFIYYGDEVGMTGGWDPDCRRGMLWDESRQDKAMLAYYRKLIAIRKANPCLVDGDADEMTAEDETGLVTIRRGGLVLLFHGKEGSIRLPQYAGKEDLISGSQFDGTLGAYQAAVIQV
ncbi:MAG: alpha amylase N-terminal ig-like domain-containing protein [Oscillospiraceae bacterium]|nr:alpha amylase N-terminal ig-like domain-containing protein [Oscillospiraceae bacterium]